MSDVYEFLAACQACGHVVEFDVRERSVGIVRWEVCPECGVSERALVGTPRALQSMGIDVGEGSR